jgi:hypothetical protein
MADQTPAPASPARDPFGHEWLLGHELERRSDEEIRRRFDAGQGSPA